MPRRTLSRRSFLATGAAALASAGLPASAQDIPITEVPGVIPSTTYPETHAAITANNPARFKILQLTDSHFFHRPYKDEGQNYMEAAGIDRDLRTVDDWKRIIDIHHPDLIAHTGDMWCDNPDGLGGEYQAQSIEWMESLGVPFLFIWGNHDQLSDVVAGHNAFHDAKGSLYRGGPSNGNYIVTISDANGTPLYELICVNTHRFGLVDTALDWLTAQAETRAAEGNHRPPGLLFHHIPTAAYIDALRAPSAGGIFLEKICNERENGAAFEQIKAMKTIKACFCGHDHTNDISGSLDGIELVYGRSSGWNGYGWSSMRKGGKLITVNCQSGQYGWESVFSDGLRWHPDPGHIIDKVVDEPFIRDPLRDALKKPDASD